jgi:hypothetical protein
MNYCLASKRRRGPILGAEAPTGDGFPLERFEPIKMAFQRRVIELSGQRVEN